MKICFVLNTHWSAAMGGAEYQASLIMQELTKKHEVYYVCRNTNEISKYIISVKGRNILARYAYCFDAIKLYKALKKINPDIVYHRDAGAYTGVCAYYCHTYKKKFLWNLASDKDVIPVKIRDYKNPLKYIDKIFLLYGIKNHQTIIAQTVEQQVLLRDNYNILDAVLIQNFHPVPTFSKKHNTVKRILWVANLKKIKRPEIFVALAKAFLNSTAVKFTMVGSFNGLYKELINEVKENVPNLEYLGSLPQSKVNQLIVDADLFVNTSVTEGFPNTFIQSWLRETPVMSMCIDPNKVIYKEKIGVIAGDLNKMINTVKHLLSSPEYFEKMGKNAVEYAKKNHSLKNISCIKSLMGIAE